jgi:hypothetical protein
MVHLYPTPTAEGLAKTKAFYWNRFTKQLTDEEAYEVLNSVMRYLYLINLPCSPTPSTPESQTSGPR